MNWFKMFSLLSAEYFFSRESQEFVEKYEGALGKGKGRKLYAYKVLMTKASRQWISLDKNIRNALS